jgi:hypothetical protein
VALGGKVGTVEIACRTIRNKTMIATSGQINDGRLAQKARMKVGWQTWWRR